MGKRFANYDDMEIQAIFSLEKQAIPAKIAAVILLLGNLIMILKTFLDISAGK